MARSLLHLECLEDRLVPATILFPQGLTGPEASYWKGAEQSRTPVDSFVRVWIRDDQGATTYKDMVPYPGFQGQVTVSQGDVTGDGVEDILTGCGNGGPGGHITLWDGARILDSLNSPDANISFGYNAGGAVLASFYGFIGYQNGVTVRLGDLNNDGKDDLIFGVGEGAGTSLHSHVRVWDGDKTLAAFSSPTPPPYDYTFELASFYAESDTGSTPGGGVSLAVERRAGADRFLIGQFFGPEIFYYELGPFVSGKQNPNLIRTLEFGQSSNSIAAWQDLSSGDLVVATTGFQYVRMGGTSSVGVYQPSVYLVGKDQSFPTKAPEFFQFGLVPPGTIINRITTANLDLDPELEILVASRDGFYTDTYDIADFAEGPRFSGSSPPGSPGLIGTIPWGGSWV